LQVAGQVAPEPWQTLEKEVVVELEVIELPLD
jgi:hypothetical protein